MGEHNTISTQEQLDYAKSFVLHQLADALHRDLESLEFDHKPRGEFGISIKVTGGQPT